MNYNDLLFRRQFLLTSNACPNLEWWKHETLGPYNLYVHPHLSHYVCHDATRQLDIVLIGYILDPGRPEEGSQEIVERLMHIGMMDPDAIAVALYPLSGRFVLLIKIESGLYVFNDACGLRTVYYSFEGTGVHIASEPNLLSLATNLIAGSRYAEYMASEYRKRSLEHWIPSGISLYENVFHLVPNHYLNVSFQTQIRYWPSHEIEALNVEDAADKAGQILVGSLAAVHKNFKLALPLTAGWDSRTVLSACREIAPDFFFYTLEYRALSAKSPDIKIPKRLLARVGLDHHVINCRGNFEDEKFKLTYENNSDVAHFHDWGMMAYWLGKNYPTEKLCVKGCCAEVARCFYYPNGKHRTIRDAEDFIHLEPGWDSLEFVHGAISNWLSGAREAAERNSVDLLDLFYWEHRIGSWQAQSQLEWDISIEQYAPFNNRQLLETLLGVESKYRCFPEYPLFSRIIARLWPELLGEAINPSFRNSLKNMLLHLGTLDLLLNTKHKLQRAGKIRKERA